MKNASLRGVRTAAVALAVGAVVLSGCVSNNQPSGLSGSIEIDGSSTVGPVSQAVAEEFHAKEPNVAVNVGISGTGGGFKRFVAGEIDIADASRPISNSEKKAAETNGTQYIELHVGTDGIAVVTNVQNTFVSCLTTAELKRIWESESSVVKWSDVRGEWPNEPMKLYGPGTDSGTFDYFSEVINGKVKSHRANYTASEDDNALVRGVEADRYSLGYFGFAYYAENKDKLRIIAVDAGKGCITPSPDTIESNAYDPLSRPLFIYVSVASLKNKPQVAAFVKFYVDNAPQLVKEVGYVPLSSQTYAEQRAKLSVVLP